MTSANGVSNVIPAAGAEVEIRKPGSEISRYGGPSAAVARASLSERMAYAQQLAQAGLLPEAYRRQPANILIAIEKGEALGIHHMVAMEGIHVIKGKSTLSAQLMRALIQRAGHMFDLVEQTRERAVVECARRERPERVFRHEWTADDAQAAELLTGPNKDNWRKYRKAMLAARVTSEAANAHFSDVLAGMVYTPEELDAVVDESGRIIDMTPPQIALPNGTANGNGHAPPQAQPYSQPQRDWLAAARSRISAAADADTLRELWKAVGPARDAGTCPQAEVDLLADEIKTRNAWLAAPIGGDGANELDRRLAGLGVKEKEHRRTLYWHWLERCAGSATKITGAEAMKIGEWLDALAGMDAESRATQIQNSWASASARDWDPETGQEITYVPRPDGAGSQWAGPGEEQQ